MILEITVGRPESLVGSVRYLLPFESVCLSCRSQDGV